MRFIFFIVFFFIISAFLYHFYSVSYIHAEENNLLNNSTFDTSIINWNINKSPQNSDASVIFEDSTCYQGGCVKMLPGSSTKLLAFSQSVGSLASNSTYIVSTFYKTAGTHYGYINLFDSNWNRSCNLSKGKSFSKKNQGDNTWRKLQLLVRIPSRDDCGEEISSHTWSVILYGHAPLSDTNAVWYDSVNLSLFNTAIPAKYSELEEQNGWEILCQQFTDSYPEVACPLDAVVQNSVDKKSGNSSLVIKGSPTTQQTLSTDIPVKPNQLYKVSVTLKISDRKTYNYVDLNYPKNYTDQSTPNVQHFIDQTSGIWSGVYSISIDDSKIFTLQYGGGIGVSNIDWFTDTSYFKVPASDPTVTIKLLMLGFDGKIALDNVSIEEVDSNIDNSYLHIPIETNFGGMKIKNVSTAPIRIETNSTVYSFTDSTIQSEKNGQIISTIQFPQNFLTGITPHAETGTVYMENNNIQLSIGADSVLLSKLKTNAVVTVQGKKVSYHDFEAGVLFVTDYTKGILVSPVRTSQEMLTMPFKLNPENMDYTYNDDDFSKVGMKFWNLTSDFNQPKWSVEYTLNSGQGFIVETFPPKDFDMNKYCSENMDIVHADLVHYPTADLRYNLQKFSEHHNIALLWPGSFKQFNNPPIEYCRDANNLIVSCSNPNATRHIPFESADVAGPYDALDATQIRNYVILAHSYGVKVIVYVSPAYYYTSNASLFLQNVKQLIDSTNLDGVYYDGLSELDSLRGLELVRRTRNMLGDKYYVQHNSWPSALIKRTVHLRIPHEDIYADYLWDGEGVKLATDDTWNLNFCGKEINNTVSVPLGELRPVNYTLSASESAALSFSPSQQIDKMLSCRGGYRTSPYSDRSAIIDKRTNAILRFSSSYLYNKQAVMCHATSCGNKTCDIYESLFNCPVDCAPPISSVSVTHSGNHYSCKTTGSVAQWILNNTPFYDLHYTFDGSIASDVSGNKYNPDYRIGETFQPPVLQEIDGRKVGVFTPETTLYSEYSGPYDFSDKNFSIFAKIKRNDNATNSQVVYAMRANGAMTLGLFQSKIYFTLKDDTNTSRGFMGTSTIDQQWHTIGVIYNKPVLSLYIDGILDKQFTTNILAYDNMTTPTYYVGKTSLTDKTTTFNGFIDDIFFNGQVLTLQQVIEYHQSGFKEFTTNFAANCVIEDNGKYFSADTISVSCAKKTTGDTNCDGKINLIDFEQWRREFLHELTTVQSDFNTDGKTDMIDFDIWRSTYFSN